MEMSFTGEQVKVPALHEPLDETAFKTRYEALNELDFKLRDSYLHQQALRYGFDDVNDFALFIRAVTAAEKQAWIDAGYDYPPFGD